ncbi:MAG TPA: pyrroline-5-carboxylate reductase [Polyangiaceae bacterium LLY-WYZ-14_1]|nr:pyrroline-5-carboxylate reductase [Polyangiaceae bacterium LLY-WYZ-14_1]
MESTKDPPTIAFVGAGNMAGAIVRGLLRSGRFPPERIICADPRRDRREELEEAHGVRTSGDNRSAVEAAEIVILSTKPQVFDRILPEVAEAARPGTLAVSIAAGVPLVALEAALPEAVRVVRVMPNTPSLVDAGAAAISGGQRATDEDVRTVQEIFAAVGETVVLDETLLDAVTGLSGSGPAYVFLIIEALADAGVKVGLHRGAAQLLAAQTVLGSAKLLLETGAHPGTLKDMVTSPGGTAIAGLHTLEGGGLRTTLMNAVEAATHRSRELGEEAARKLQPHRGTRREDEEGRST